MSAVTTGASHGACAAMPDKQEEPIQDWSDIGHLAGSRIKWLIAGVIDGLTFVAWVGLQYAADTYFVEKLTLSGGSATLARIIQIAFAIITLIPLGIFIIQDISIMAVRGYRNIMREIKKESVHKSSDQV
jgi:hypothetical protein